MYARKERGSGEQRLPNFNHEVFLHFTPLQTWIEGGGGKQYALIEHFK